MCKGSDNIWNIQAEKKNNSTFQYYILYYSKKNCTFAGRNYIRRSRQCIDQPTK